MANEFEDRIIQDFARDIASRLGEAAAIARTADAYGKQGLAERAFQSLLELEPLLQDAKSLLIATAVVRRRDRERVDGDEHLRI